MSATSSEVPEELSFFCSILPSSYVTLPRADFARRQSRFKMNRHQHVSLAWLNVSLPLSVNGSTGD